jgi:hypothetical protein
MSLHRCKRNRNLSLEIVAGPCALERDSGWPVIVELSRSKHASAERQSCGSIRWCFSGKTLRDASKPAPA